MNRRSSMLKILGAALALLIVVGCGGSSNKPETTAPVVSAASDESLKLGFGEMKLVDVDKNNAITIHADGTIEYGGKTIVKVTADGKLIKIDTGEVGLSLQPDGSIQGPNGEPLGLQLGVDGTLVAGDRTISLDPTGKLVGGNPGSPQLRVEGATDASLKRTAMFVLVAVAMPGTSKTPDAAAAPPAP